MGADEVGTENNQHLGYLPNKLMLQGTNKLLEPKRRHTSIPGGAGNGQDGRR